MRSKEIYIEFERLKNDRDHYTEEEYIQKMDNLKRKLFSNMQPEFEPEVKEKRSLKNLLRST